MWRFTAVVYPPQSDTLELRLSDTAKDKVRHRIIGCPITYEHTGVKHVHTYLTLLDKEVTYDNIVDACDKIADRFGKDEMRSVGKVVDSFTSLDGAVWATFELDPVLYGGLIEWINAGMLSAVSVSHDDDDDPQLLELTLTTRPAREHCYIYHSSSDPNECRRYKEDAIIHGVHHTEKQLTTFTMEAAAAAADTSPAGEPVDHAALIKSALGKLPETERKALETQLIALQTDRDQLRSQYHGVEQATKQLQAQLEEEKKRREAGESDELRKTREMLQATEKQMEDMKKAAEAQRAMLKNNLKVFMNTAGSEACGTFGLRDPDAVANANGIELMNDYMSTIQCASYAMNQLRQSRGESLEEPSKRPAYSPPQQSAPASMEDQLSGLSPLDRAIHSMFPSSTQDTSYVESRFASRF